MSTKPRKTAKKPVKLKIIKAKSGKTGKARPGLVALPPFEPSIDAAGAPVLDRIFAVIEQRRLSGDVTNSHSARLLARGTAKVAQKLGEEAVECVIEAVAGNRDKLVAESADVLYHLLLVWADAGVLPAEVWAELARREGMSGIAEKAARPKLIARLAKTTKLP
jgi:phosphoribosyl-ATP pyrophosphohydrolase